MDTTGIAGIISAVGGIILGIITAVATLYPKWKKPLDQATVVVDGVTAGVEKISTVVNEYNTLVAEAKKNDGVVDPAEMAQIITKMGSHTSEIASLVSATVAEVKTVGSTVTATANKAV